MALYILCRIVDILSIVVLVVNSVHFVQRRETPFDVIAACPATLWCLIECAWMGPVAFSIILVCFVLDLWLAEEYIKISNRRGMYKSVESMFSNVLLSGEGHDEAIGSIIGELTHNPERTSCFLDTVETGFTLHDLLILIEAVNHDGWDITTLHDKQARITSSRFWRSSNMTTWTFRTNIIAQDICTPEIFVIPSHSMMLGIDGEYNPKLRYRVDLWDPNFMSISNSRSMTSRRLLALTWAFIWLYENTSMYDNAFSGSKRSNDPIHLQIRTDTKGRLCFVVWNSRINYYMAYQLRVMLNGLLDGLEWRRRCDLRYNEDESFEGIS